MSGWSCAVLFSPHRTLISFFLWFIPSDSVSPFTFFVVLAFFRYFLLPIWQLNFSVNPGLFQDADHNSYHTHGACYSHHHYDCSHLAHQTHYLRKFQFLFDHGFERSNELNIQKTWRSHKCINIIIDKICRFYASWCSFSSIFSILQSFTTTTRRLCSSVSLWVCSHFEMQSFASIATLRIMLDSTRSCIETDENTNEKYIKTDGYSQVGCLLGWSVGSVLQQVLTMRNVVSLSFTFFRRI